MRTESPRHASARVSAALLLAIATATGCHAGTSPEPAAGGGVETAAATQAAAAAQGPAEALCRPADAGSLQARLQGAIDSEINWQAPATPQCLGGPRPGDGGLRLLYKGTTTDAQSLLVVVGIAMPLQAGTARHVPANVTIVREGAGVFYATQGEDKCALDEVGLEPIEGSAGRYRLTGRGYCTQPARAVGTDAGGVLMSRFDVTALLDAPVEP